MKKLAVVLAVLFVGSIFASSASATLRQRVAKLEAKIECLKRVGVSHFIGFAWYEDNNTGDVHALANPPDLSDSYFALATNQAARGTADYHFLALRNTPACRRRFGVVANPYARMAASQRAGTLGRMQRLQRMY